MDFSGVKIGSGGIAKVVLGLAVAGLIGSTALAAEANDSAKAAIAKVGQAFAKAFEAGDAQGVAAAWTPDGEYTDLDGVTFRGRADIQNLFERVFASTPGRTISIESESLTFPAPGVALESGVTTVAGQAGPSPSRARFANVFVEQNGQWLIASVHDSPFVAPDRSQELGPLAPLLGVWTADLGEGQEIRVEAAPNATGNFVLLERTVFQNGQPVGGGTEWIAWDAANKSIRSWSFESDGGFSESDWKSEGHALVVSTRATLRNGSKVEEVQKLSGAEDGLLVFEAVSLSLDGAKQPLAKPVKFKRPGPQS
ncbi:MAG: YybH family protein [Chthoniobacterales bacterium]